MAIKQADYPPDGPVELAAGPLSLFFENGYIRAIHRGDIEIVRRIYMALRDENWNTIPGNLSCFSLLQNKTSFALSFDSHHRRSDIDFLWRGEIKGSSSGELSFTMKGAALSGFRRNRIGLCVLHPLPLCKGRPCRIETVDGSIVNASFPEAIAPYPIFKEVVGLSYDGPDGSTVKITFEGDTFETEDQRNWTDATFKTYSTPAALPVPVFVEKGDEVYQKTTVTFDQPVAACENSASGFQRGPIMVAFRSLLPMYTLPSIGAIGPALGKHPSPDAAHVLPKLSHLRMDIHFESGDIGPDVAHAERVCRDQGIPIELALHFTDDCVAEVASLARFLQAHPFRIDRFLIYKSNQRSTPAATITAVCDSLRRIAPGASIVSGTNNHFLEINKVHPPHDLLDGICFSATPQSHTFDDVAIMENLPGLCETVMAARAVSGSKPVLLSPLTLRPRKLPHLPQKDGGPDARSTTLFGAAWTLGAIANCARGGVSSLTLDEIDTRSPIAVLLSWILDEPVQRMSLVQISAYETGRIAGIELFTKTGFTAIAANLTNADLAVSVTGLPEKCRCRILDERSFGGMFLQSDGKSGFDAEKACSPDNLMELTLPPYALVKFSGLRQE